MIVIKNAVDIENNKINNVCILKISLKIKALNAISSQTINKILNNNKLYFFYHNQTLPVFI